MQDVLKYLEWGNTEKGVRITKCDQCFEGAMAIPDHINGLPIVEIGKKAFAGCEKITSVALPDTVEVVGAGAFCKCEKLKELRLGTGIKKIEKNAFKFCSSLRRVFLPSTIVALSRDAFGVGVELILDDDSLSNDDDERL